MSLYLELLFILALLIIQVYFFISTNKSIYLSTWSIPEAETFYIKHIDLGKESLAEHSVQQLLDQSHELPDVRNEPVSRGSVRIQLVYCTTPNAMISQVLYAINTYLIRNKGAAADFHLIKDIVERHTDARDREINISLPLPLYLGLMGTMIGIIFGLFGMGSLADVGSDLTGIDKLLNGVKVAMIASAAGLALTTVNSGFFYKGAKSEVQRRKNAFYTFIQVELLPILNQSMNSGIIDLNRSFEKFTSTFHGQLSSLGGLVSKNHETLTTQQQVLTTLENLDLKLITKYNLTVAQELSKHIQSIASLNKESEKLSLWVSKLDQFITTTYQLNEQIGHALAKGDKINGLASDMSELVRGAGDQQRFLQSHFSALEERKTVINSTVAKVDATLQDSFNEFLGFNSKMQQQFKDQMERWRVDAEDHFKANGGALGKLNRLDDLQTSFQHLIRGQENLLTEIKQMNEHQKVTHHLLHSLKSSRIWGRRWQALMDKLNRILSRLFSSKTPKGSKENTK